MTAFLGFADLFAEKLCFSDNLERLLAALPLIKMLTPEKLEQIGERYGQYASWAIWNASDINDTSMIEAQPHELRTDVVMVGLNVSADISGRRWTNFHAGRNDHKLTMAFNESRFRGAYMTDIVKSLVMVKATDVMKGIRRGDVNIAEHAETFREEMRFIGEDRERLFFLFGRDAVSIFEKHLARSFPNFVRCEHFACYRKKEDWLRDLWLAIDRDESQA